VGRLRKGRGSWEEFKVFIREGHAARGEVWATAKKRKHNWNVEGFRAYESEPSQFDICRKGPNMKGTRTIRKSRKEGS